MTSIRSDLPPAVTAALEASRHDPGIRAATGAAGIAWSSIAWGDPGGVPLLLVHGVTASARIWWRVGPALAATGRHVTAVDLPGHGRTGAWLGHHRFPDNARDLAAWIRPARIVLLDPPAVPLARIAQMASDPSEQPTREINAAMAALAAANPGWSAGDVEAKAEALVEVDLEAARAIVLDNGDWDGGLEDLSDPTARDIPTWIVRGDPASGGLLLDEGLPALSRLVGADHVITLAGALHAPQRTHAKALVAALLRALG